MDDEFPIVKLIDIIFNKYCFSIGKSLSFHLPNNSYYSIQYRLSFNSLLHSELNYRCDAALLARLHYAIIGDFATSKRETTLIDFKCSPIFLKNSQYSRPVKNFPY